MNYSIKFVVDALMLLKKGSFKNSLLCFGAIVSNDSI